MFKLRYILMPYLGNPRPGFLRTPKEGARPDGKVESRPANQSGSDEKDGLVAPGKPTPDRPVGNELSGMNDETRALLNACQWNDRLPEV
jgi:hypothetical protein